MGRALSRADARGADRDSIANHRRKFARDRTKKYNGTNPPPVRNRNEFRSAVRSFTLPHRLLATRWRLRNRAVDGSGGGTENAFRGDDGPRESFWRCRILQQGQREGRASRDRMRGVCLTARLG